MKPADVRKQIASGDTAPLYLIEGDDVQSRHDLAVEFASVVDEGLRAFNVESFYANEASSQGARDELATAILSAARTLPMMTPRRVLIVHEAERLLSPRKAKDEDAEPPQAPAGGRPKRSLTPMESLEEYLETPEPLTTILFVAGALDENRRLVKLVRKHAVTVDCGTVGSPAEAERWIKARIEKDGLTIDSQAANLLVEFVGSSLGSLRAAVDKLVLFAAGQPSITPRHVREVVTPQSEPGEGFALGRAIWAGNARAALRELGAQLDHGLTPWLVLGQIRAAARSLEPDDRARRGLDAVLQTDLSIKSSEGEPRYLLERLVVELCGRR